jgi:hypothetical protein
LDRTVWTVRDRGPWTVRDRGPSGSGPDRPGPDRLQSTSCMYVAGSQSSNNDILFFSGK